ncbi:MAG: 50S ribosomal protein L23 [Chryseobacterium sp.]|nr:MAG: 50S ribosomal protein L23 [Chryseobacterium sp.]
MIAVVLKPVITEKSMRLAASGTYMFNVSMDANKPRVAQAVKEQFKVDATQVRIAITKGKVKKLKGITGKRKDTKRAFVTVKKGQKISVFEITEEEKK